MIQAKFSIEEVQVQFLKRYRSLGFKDKSSMLRAAISHFKKAFELEELKHSANLYSDIYSEEEALRELTESAIDGWPK